MIGSGWVYKDWIKIIYGLSYKEYLRIKLKDWIVNSLIVGYHWLEKVLQVLDR